MFGPYRIDAISGIKWAVEIQSAYFLQNHISIQITISVTETAIKTKPTLILHYS